MFENSEIKISNFRTMTYIIHLFSKREYFVHLIFLLSKMDIKFFDKMHIKLIVPKYLALCPILI